MSLYQRLFALGYDPLLALAERAGLHDLRQELLAGAAGRVVEIGAGSGLNVPLYPPHVTDIVCTEPEPAMRRRLAQRAADHPVRPAVVDAAADRLPVETGSVDTVVSTLVLCTVADPAATLAEVRRVLAADGRLLLIEHVRADELRLQRWQDRLHRPWRAFAAGCHTNRDTVTALQAAGFDTSRLQQDRWHRVPPIVAPLVYGAAVPFAG